MMMSDHHIEAWPIAAVRSDSFIKPIYWKIHRKRKTFKGDFDELVDFLRHTYPTKTPHIHYYPKGSKKGL